ncbi:MAG: hypothetical protein CML66_00580 [Rhodobacteraceae bacterium]|nr:hypothetical protein [Paracoccaceae bacterium]MAY45807.1 hypothetical protein [Paracoccaceae bacterium]
MDRLTPLQTFVAVVRAGSFTAAAAALSMPRSTVSLHIKTLEQTLGTRLLKRSTRSLSLTEDGQVLFDRAEDGLRTLTGAMDMVRNRPDRLSGLIRLTAPADFPTTPIARAVTAFRRQHPAVRFRVLLTNTALDLIGDDVDIALRIGSGGGGGARIERRLAPVAWHFCASPDWLDRNALPSGPAQITDFIAPPPGLRAFLERVVLAGRKLPAGAIIADNQLMARDLVLAGAGIGLLPAGLCTDLIGAGRLHLLWPDLITAAPPLNLTFASRADITHRVRAFADVLAGEFR